MENKFPTTRWIKTSIHRKTVQKSHIYVNGTRKIPFDIKIKSEPGPYPSKIIKARGKKLYIYVHINTYMSVHIYKHIHI